MAKRKRQISTTFPSAYLYENNTASSGAGAFTVTYTPQEKPIHKYPGAVQCLRCKMILVSFSRHDYKTCRCPNETMVDGGHDYLRCGGLDMSLVQVLRFTTARKPKKLPPAKKKWSRPNHACNDFETQRGGWG